MQAKLDMSLSSTLRPMITSPVNGPWVLWNLHAFPARAPPSASTPPSAFLDNDVSCFRTTAMYTIQALLLTAREDPPDLPTSDSSSLLVSPVALRIQAQTFTPFRIAFPHGPALQLHAPHTAVCLEQSSLPLSLSQTLFSLRFWKG